MGKGVFHGSVLLNQFRGALFSNALCARYVVHRVAHQRHHVDHSFRGHAQNLFHSFFVHDYVGLRPARSSPQRSHVPSDQLHHVLVIRNNQYLYITLCGLLCQRANHVIRFESRHFQNWHPHRLAKLFHVRQLYTHLVRHRLALRFVFFE